MRSWKTDRTTIFLVLALFSFLLDLAYFVGIRDPSWFPHPFVIFRTLGDIEFLRGFPRMLRYVIFSSVSGALIGITAARLVARSVWLTQSALRALRLGQWLPFLILFATPDAIDLSFIAAVLCSCYHYLVATSILGLEARETRNYVALETALRIFFFYLLSQIWLHHWNWFEFAAIFQPATGVGVLITLIVLLSFIYWVFRSKFELAAERCGTTLRHFQSETWQSACGYLLFAFLFLMFWWLLGYFIFRRWMNSPLRIFQAGYDLLSAREIYGDSGHSLFELLGGLVLGGCVAMLVIALVSVKDAIRKPVFLLVPLLNISPIVLWLILFAQVRWFLPAPGFLNYWHKVILIGCLTVFPFVQVLWVVRDRPGLYRTLVAIEFTLPRAFVAMCFGELYAASAGLGLMMTIASATSQFDKGLAVFLVTAVLLIGLSSMLRWTARRLSFSAVGAPVTPTR